MGKYKDIETGFIITTDSVIGGDWELVSDEINKTEQETEQETEEVTEQETEEVKPKSKSKNKN